MDFVHYLYRKYPNLKKDLIRAHLKVTPLNFIKRSFMNAITFSMLLSFFGIFVVSNLFENMGLPQSFAIVFVIFILFPMLFMYSFTLFLKMPIVAIKKRRQDIDRDVLFAGRYLLVKLNSGKPLLNSLIDASKTYGVGSKYFREIVDNITLGMPIEEAIDRAMVLTPSKNFEMILFQISNALKIGVDVSTSLQSVLEDITDSQLNMIDAYSHKLNSIALFYMMLAVVMPSLGLTIFSVIAVFMNIPINAQVYVLLWVIILCTQFFFMHIFRSIRPDINF